MRPELSPAHRHRRLATTRSALLCPVLATVLAWGWSPALAWAGAPAPVDFGRDILPILSDKCFLCHGPDPKARKAGLRLDTRGEALREKDPVILPGKSDESELFIRVASRDESEVMP